MPNYIHRYVLYTTGLEAPMWYVQGRTVAVRTIGLRTQNLEFILVVGSTVDGLGKTCRLLSASVPTQMGFSCYSTLHGELPFIIKGEGLCLHSGSKLSELMKGIQCHITVSYSSTCWKHVIDAGNMCAPALPYQMRCIVIACSSFLL